jgi:gamma-glutamyl hercynylcysteine S-oxide synthase
MTIAVAPDRALLKDLAERLHEARARTFLLVAPLSAEELHAQHDPLMSPILWDLGHIAHFEELWLTRNLDGPIEFVEMPGLYNPFEHPRSQRGALSLPGLDECRAIMDEIRGRVLARIAASDLEDANPLLRDGYVYRMVLQHEYQHDETMLQTLQLKLGAPYAPAVRFELPSAPPGRGSPGHMVRFPGAAVEIGTDDRSAAYDNERPRHVAEVRPFLIDVNPVTNGDFLTFIAADGYAKPEYWSDGGRRWLAESGAQAPKYWFSSEGRWMTRVMDRAGAVEPRHPVCHVSWYDA